ncbi:MAG: hypothetical protein AAF500_21585 [Myxococcota bacterium]
MRPSLYQWGALVIILALSFGAVRAGWDDQSVTKDEWPHLVRGLAYWNTADPRLSFAHPPLPNAAAALPAHLGFDTDISQLPGWERGNNRKVADALLLTDYGDLRERLFRARAVMFGFLALLVAYVFAFLRRHVGMVAAVAGALCVGLNPTFLAHARLVTTDLPVTTFAVIAAGESISFAVGRRWWRLATAALALAACALSKHSGLGVVAICVLVTSLMLLAGPWLGRTEGVRARVKSVLVFGATAGLVLVVAVLVAYRFDGVGHTVDEIRDAERHRYAIRLRRTSITHYDGSLRIPLPSTWVVGLFSTGAHVQEGHTGQWFWGEANPSGRWFYFPTLIALKLPLGFHVGWLSALVFGVGFVVSWLRKRGSLDPSAAIALGLAACASLLAIGLVSSRLNIGLRHALPLVGLLALFAGWGLGRLWIAGGGLRVLAVIAMISIPAELVWTAPHYLSYFNVAVGRAQGHEISKLGESWGQTRAKLVRFLLENDMQPVSMSRLSPTVLHELRYLGLDQPSNIYCRGDEPDTRWAVILEEEYARAPGCYAWARDMVPAHRLLEHFRIYDLRPLMSLPDEANAVEVDGDRLSGPFDGDEESGLEAR